MIYAEAAIATTLPPGQYTAILRGKTNGVGLLEFYDISGNSNSRLVNISTRMKVEQGDNGALIGGFIITGHDPQRVAIRGRYRGERSPSSDTGTRAGRGR